MFPNNGFPECKKADVQGCMHVVQDVHVMNSLSGFFKTLWKFMC